MVANPISHPSQSPSPLHSAEDRSSAAAAEQVAVKLRIRGTVQGVGFRPMVYQVAIAHHLRGEVYNDASGVIVQAAGPATAIDQFVAALGPSAPPLAQIESLERSPLPISTIPHDTFQITPSRTGHSRTQIAPDAATCSQCLSDTFGPFSRFFRYPFTNCTHCGPRLSIIHAIPYDRAQTSMATFPLCPTCEGEYDDPLNRRFHAQPVACHHCGPKAWLERANGRAVVADMFSMVDDVDAVCTLLQRGEIVAIKGIGGFHLACDATNETAVSQLRQRKHRYHKPFALMVRDLTVIEPYCEVSEAERALLESPTAPIVVLRRQAMGQGENGATPPTLAPSLAPNLPSLGVMLPYTPLHHLILKRMNRPIVLTSGNVSDEPQCIDNDDAREKLGAIAPFLLLHNRDIVNRVDDSVVQVVAGQHQTLRRARGYAPAPLPLPEGFEQAPPILAMGAELKSTFCLGRGREAIVSQHLGDLENALAFDAYQDTLALYRRLFEHEAVAIATDLHPDYLSTQLGQQLAQEQGLPLHGIQHHHAHIAACLVEHSFPLNSTPVLGIALDGLGYGDDGTLWGGEFLIADYRTSRRVAHLEPMALLGGAQAMRQPWRNTYAQIRSALDGDTLIEQFGDLDLVQFLTAKPRPVLDQMLTNQVNSPLASSAGRLFDAVAAAVGCCRDTASYEGQGAIELEGLIHPDDLQTASPYPFIVETRESMSVLSARPLWSDLLQDIQQGRGRSPIAARFHRGFAEAIAHLATDLAHPHHLQHIVLSGGVFQNQVLLVLVTELLRQHGFTVLTPHHLPPNDGGIALGQVAIASAQLI